jgi:hypothetical protein
MHLLRFYEQVLAYRLEKYVFSFVFSLKSGALVRLFFWTFCELCQTGKFAWGQTSSMNGKDTKYHFSGQNNLNLWGCEFHFQLDSLYDFKLLFKKEYNWTEP